MLGPNLYPIVCWVEYPFIYACPDGEDSTGFRLVFPVPVPADRGWGQWAGRVRPTLPWSIHYGLILRKILFNLPLMLSLCQVCRI